MYDNILAPHLRDGAPLHESGRARMSGSGHRRHECGQPACPHHPAAPRRTARRPQALHRRVEHQRPPRARRHQDRRCRSVPSRRSSFSHVLQRVSGELLAALVDPEVGGAARGADRARAGSTCTGARPPVPGSSWRAGRFTTTVTSRRRSSSRSASSRSRTAAGSGSTSPPTAPVTLHDAGWYAPVPAPGTAQHRGGHADVQPARRLCQHAARR